MPEIPETLKLGGLEVEIPEVARQIAGLVANGTTFAQVSVAPGSLIPPLPLQGAGTVPLQDARFTLGGSVDAKLAVSVFNEPGDVDEDGILQPVAGRAWLKHQVRADVKGAATGTAGGLGFGIDASLGATLAQYRAHQPSDPVAAALISDVQGFLLPLRPADVQKLGDGDILAFTVHGTLALHARLTWADALSAAITTLDERLGAPGASAIRLDASASVDVSLGVEDDFRLLFRRGSADGTTRVEVRKTRARSASLAAGFNLQASVADPETLQQLLEAYASSRLGRPWAKVEALAGRVDSALSLDALSPEDRELAEAVGGRLGLADVRQEWQELRDRLTGLPGDLSARLRQALAARLKAEVRLEYSRVSSGEVVLACELRRDALERHHGQLLRGNLAELGQALAAGRPGYTLIEYLNTKTVTKRLSFGVAISLGRWAASGRDETFREWSRQADLAETHERRSFVGRRTYEAQWGGRGYHYAFGLGAAMDRFSTGRTANASEFGYSLSFGWSWREPLTATLMAEALDLANVWNVLPQEENEATMAAVLAQAGGPVLVEVEVSISDDGVRSLLAVPPNRFEEAWVEAMAAALPRVQRPPKVFRSRVQDRVLTYREAARFAVENPAGAEIAAIAGRIQYRPIDPRNPAEVATRTQLERIDRGEIADGALPDLGLKVLWTSSTPTTRPAGRLQRARQTLEDLAEAISGNGKHEQIQRTFDDLQELITRPYEQRLLGRLVTALVSARKPGEIVKTVKVTPDNGEPILI